MGAVTAAPHQVNTILYGVRDQAALYCLLARLRALGVEAIGLRRGSDCRDRRRGPRRTRSRSTPATRWH